MAQSRWGHRGGAGVGWGRCGSAPVPGKSAAEKLRAFKDRARGLPSSRLRSASAPGATRVVPADPRPPSAEACPASPAWGAARALDVPPPAPPALRQRHLPLSVRDTVSKVTSWDTCPEPASLAGWQGSSCSGGARSGPGLPRPPGADLQPLLRGVRPPARDANARRQRPLPAAPASQRPLPAGVAAPPGAQAPKRDETGMRQERQRPGPEATDPAQAPALPPSHVSTSLPSRACFPACKTRPPVTSISGASAGASR